MRKLTEINFLVEWSPSWISFDLYCFAWIAEQYIARGNIFYTALQELIFLSFWFVYQNRVPKLHKKLTLST